MILSNFLKKIMIDYKELSFYQQAFIHNSYKNENKEIYDYEALEFLGDSIICFVVAEYLYSHYKKLQIDLSPAELSKTKHFLASGETLIKAAKSLEMEELIVVGKNIKLLPRNASIFADVFEALTAAIYLDLGLDRARQFLIDFLIIPFFRKGNEIVEPRGELQQWAQQKKKVLPIYDFEKHNNYFLSTCKFLDSKTEGKGQTKKKEPKKRPPLCFLK